MAKKKKPLLETAREFAQRYNRELRANDRRFDRIVQVVTCDGTSMIFHHAFVLRYIDSDGRGWMMVFCEHHPPQLFEDDENEVQIFELVHLNKTVETVTAGQKKKAIRARR